MLIKMKKASDIKSSDITPESVYLDRRRFLSGAAIAGTGLAASSLLLPNRTEAATSKAAFKDLVKSKYSIKDKPTSFKSITTYNNFYEFGTDKGAPARSAKNFKTKPWKIVVEGEVGKPGTYDYDDIIKPHKLEERIYRFRCVEAWSMVIPWVGIPLGDILKRFEPTSKAKYVAFETLHDPKQMPGQRRSILDWPYREGLRIDEAMHPLAILGVGLYGREMPNQNGAPIRLVVPWKYGFKSIKSIVKIRLTDKMPDTSWNLSAPREYGFYSNVNPEVSHPRWSQSKERLIGNFLKQKTFMLNGYADEVASLYTGMDLNKNF
ncbi:protein-methionine-sulfoxide reductase catalytic subunit MsrP [bacterium]|jgi:methionine sulfoxide reductase catalytic subunit|nr:protein-methionine-sulfoxide reductase catalytic subunit MsrP [bacterium]